MGFNTSMAFTNKVHDDIAIPRIYEPFDLTNVVSEVGTIADMREGIDYTVYRPDGSFTVQERFRKPKYKNYRDITFRYDKPSARGDTRREFFNIKADAFLYGIINDAGDDFTWAYMFSVEPVVEAIKAGTMPHQYRSNGVGDTGFIAIDISAIDAIDANIIKYKL
jgi:hypothetical protein